MVLRAFFVLPLVLCVTILTSIARSAVQSAAPSEQQTQNVSGNPVLDRAEADLVARRWKAAHDLIVPWLKSHPAATDRDRGLYLLAQVYFQSGDRVRSFYHLDELLDTYPASKLYTAALQLQYDLADDYLNGRKDTFLGLPILSMEDEAVEMLFRIQERAPGSPVAQAALKRTADYYFNTSQFDLAGDAYQAYLRTYPRSDDVPTVRLRQAFSSLARFRGPKYDATPLIDARSQFKLIEVQYPNLAAENNVPQWIAHIDADLSRKAYSTGDFFRRTGKLHGAAYMYRYVVQTYPNSPEAPLAKKALARIPAAILKDAPPPSSNPEAAAQPSPAETVQPQPPPPGTKAR